MKNYKFIISGKVQGVYYRVNIKKNALSAGYNGYVKNISNGRVEACVSCEESRVTHFIDILNQGSAKSQVDTIEQLECDEVFNDKFTIR